MANITTLLLIPLIILLLIISIRYVMRDANTVRGLTSGKTMQRIEPSELEHYDNPTSPNNFSYSIWFFIDDWNYRYGEEKMIFGRMLDQDKTDPNPVLEPCPSVVLNPINNNLVVSLAVYPGVNEPLDLKDKDKNKGRDQNMIDDFIIHKCGVANIPLQKWCNLIVSVYNRTLDIYLDGKLVRTDVLPGIAKVNSLAPVYVTPMGGFSGWTSRFQYWADSMDTQKAWNVYQAGFGGSWFGNMFGRYSVKVSVVENDQVASSLTI